MRKIASLIVFAVFLIGTWHLVHSTSPVGFETHSGIQEHLQRLILDAIKAKKPEAKDITIMRLWTETVDENKVRAVFAYKFSEPGPGGELTEHAIEGESILHREASEDAKIDKWVIQQVRTTGDSLTFSDGILITPNGTDGDDEEAPATTAPGTTAAPAATPAKTGGKPAGPPTDEQIDNAARAQEHNHK